MNLIIVHKSNPAATNTANSCHRLLRFALANESLAGVVLNGLSRCLHLGGDKPIFCAIPEAWKVGSHTTRLKTVTYVDNVPICQDLLKKIKRNIWVVISNARFAAQVDSQLLNKLLVKNHADVLSLNVEPNLLNRREKIRLTDQGKVAGFRRLYSDSIEPAPVSNNWPHHLFIKTALFEKLLENCTLNRSFSSLLEKCQSNSMRVCGANMGGVVFDLETKIGLLNFCRMQISNMRYSRFEVHDSNTISKDSKLIGKILLGKNIQVGPKTTIIGPAVISNNVKVEEGAVINSSIIGSNFSVPKNILVQNNVVDGKQTNWELLSNSDNNYERQKYSSFFESGRKLCINESFRCWPRFSYAGGFKRITDVFFAVIILILFAPIIPFIALAIKITSPGPVFFKHKRQGRYGKIFNCLKFRTMKIGADEMQDKLRFVSQVDGPQFKMVDDPRISAVGRFLRETYLDEIPQFINVLLGQMSVVGPRPSPEAENTLCPFWRDARLSVRPGITGLWQIFRTRQPMKDFQEWIHYDTEYVRNLSLKIDLWISFKTVKKLFDNFISQF